MVRLRMERNKLIYIAIYCMCVSYHVKRKRNVCKKDKSLKYLQFFNQNIFKAHIYYHISILHCSLCYE